MKKSVVFIIILLLIIAAEIWALYYHSKHPTPVQYQLASAEYDIPEPDISGIKPFLFENGWIDEINNALDEIQTILEGGSNDKFLQSLNNYTVRQRQATVAQQDKQKALASYIRQILNEPYSIKGEYLGNNLCIIEGRNSICETGVYKLDEHCIACYDGLCTGTVCSEKIKVSPPTEVTQEEPLSAKDIPAPQPIAGTPTDTGDAELSAPIKIDNQKPMIAVIIDDVGLSVPFTNQISKIQIPVTVAFLPYGASNKEQVLKLKNAGFEVMLHVPMMPYVKASLAPNTLSPEMSKDDIQDKLRVMLSRFAGTGMVGANNHMGSKFTESETAMSAVAELLKRENLFFLDSKTTSKSVAKSVCRKYGVPYIARDVFLDNERKYDEIMRQFLIAERIAKKRGYAVAIGHPYSQTLQALKDWEKDLDKHGVQIVPLSYLVHKTNGLLE